MTQLSDLASKIRSKNAGPFWLTIDIFFDRKENYRSACNRVDNGAVAKTLGSEVTSLKRFEIDDLMVLKFSLPRPHVQGTRFDRDMHGASFANLLGELKL